MDMLASSKKLEDATQHFEHAICSFTVVQSLTQCVELTEYDHFRAIFVPFETRSEFNGEVVVSSFDVVKTLRNAGADIKVFLCVKKEEYIPPEKMDKIRGAFSGILTCPFLKEHLYDALKIALSGKEDGFYDRYSLFTAQAA